MIEYGDEKWGIEFELVKLRWGDIVTLYLFICCAYRVVKKMILKGKETLLRYYLEGLNDYTIIGKLSDQ